MHTGAALIAALAVMAVSLAGVIFTSARFGAWMRRYLTYLATASAGVFLLIAYHLAEEAVHEGGWIVGVGSVLLGAALMEGIHWLLPTKHHHHGHSPDHAHSPIDGRGVLISDALHNVGDGILLVGAFASNIYVGIAATVGVLLHEAVQEISEYFVLREAGYSNREALSRNFTVSATILIGIFAATYLSSFELILALLSGIAAGGFLSVVFHDLLPHAFHSVRTNGGAYVHVAALLFGAGAMFGLQSAFPHEEPEESPVDAVVMEVPNEIVVTTPVSSPRTSIPASPVATTSTGTRPESATTSAIGSDSASADGATSSPQTLGTPN